MRVYGCFYCGGSEDPQITHHILYTTLYNKLDAGWLCRRCLREIRTHGPKLVHSGLTHLHKHVNAAIGDNASFSSIHPKFAKS